MGGKAGSRWKKYRLDVSRVASWSEQLAYFVGLVATDGYVKDRTIVINLKSSDYPILSALHGWLDAQTKLGIYKRTDNKGSDYCHLQIYSQEVSNFLYSIGIPRAKKTTTLSELDIPDPYFRDFLRGVIDGDGSIQWHGRQLTIDISGTENFLSYIKRKILFFLPIIEPYFYRGHEFVCRMRWSGESADKIREYIYDGASLFMPRKRNVAYRNHDRLVVSRPFVQVYDHRGDNVEIYDDDFHSLGINWVQSNISTSKKYVLRGIHVNKNIAKFATCVFGEMYLVVVNCKEHDADFGKWRMLHLTSGNRLQVFIPPGYGSAHLVVSDEAVFYYKWSDYFENDPQRTYRWDSFGINWPIPGVPILSERDKQGVFVSAVSR